MRHLFIINPVAGGQKGNYAKIELEIKRVMAGFPEPYEIYVTRAPLDATEKIKSEADTGALRVYACGGDGTFNECVNGAAGFSHTAVTHFPCGTGNDFIKMFGAADARKFRDLAALVRGETRKIDVIECNGRLGINICSVGIDARIGGDVHKYSGLPLVGGAAGYIVSLAVNMIKGVSQTLRISTEGGTMSGDFTLICACNGRYYGGGFNPVPTAMPNDGIIDFLIINGVSRLKVLQVVGKYAKGRFCELGDMVTHIRGQELQVECEDELAVNIDGEMLYSKNVHFKMLPGGVNVIFPAEMEFFASSESKSGEISRK